MNRLLALIIAIMLARTGCLAVEPLPAVAWDNYRPGGRSVSVYDIERDVDGMVWLGTNNGLYAFDGFTSHRISAGDAARPFNAHVQAIVPCDDGLWLGTNNGLCRYDRQTRLIVPVEGVGLSEIRAMLAQGDRLLIGTLDGLYVYDTVSRRLSQRLEGLPHRAVYALYRYGGGADADVYVGTYDGLCRWQPSTGRVERVAVPADVSRGRNLFVNAITTDPSHGCLLLGTEGALLRYYPRSGRMTAVEGFGGSSVKALASTPERRIVAGTDDGLYLLDDPGDGTVDLSICRHDSRDHRSIINNTVWSVMVDADGTIMAGTEMGLSIADIDSPVRVIELSDLTGRGEGQQIYSIMRDRDGWLWLGGTGGLIRTREGAAPEWYRPGDKTHPLSHNRVRDIRQLSDGSIYVATDGSLNLFDPERHTFVNCRITDRTGRRNANWAYSIVEDKPSGKLWTGAYLGGILLTDARRLAAASHGACVADSAINASNGLANDFVNSIVADEAGNRWVLLFRDSCLTRIDRHGRISRIDVHSRATGAYPTRIVPAGGGVWTAAGTLLTRIDGSGRVKADVTFPCETPDEAVLAMAAVGGEVWASTTGGEVWALDTATMHARLLPLPAMDYTAIYRDPVSGRVLLGSVDRMVAVDPARMDRHSDSDRLYVVRALNGTDELHPSGGRLRLPARSGQLTVELATYDYSPGTARRFAYRLADIDSTWTLLPDGDNTLELRNLPEGDHRLEMMLQDVPESLQTLYVSVDAPWYRTRTAIGLYVLCALLAATAVAAAVRRRQRHRIEQIERAAALDKVDERIEFLSNMSHDLKTPLSMIIGPLSRLREEPPADPGVSRGIEVAYHNALKLNDLIHRTIEWNHVEAQTDAMLIYSRVDAVDFCRTIFDSYAEAYPGRRFVFTAGTDRIIADVDAVKLESVLNNLLSNAVKYTSEGATLSCSVAASDDRRSLLLTVADDGPGIPVDERNLIFQRMYRSARTSDRSEGTGLGLYLVKRYVEMHGGTISVEGREGQGATFVITLPLSEPDADSPARDASGHLATSPVTVPAEGDNRPRVLIVDDNMAITDFIADLLAADYNVATAANGKAGMAVAETFRPDLIIADEMMPVMTGIEMTRRLRGQGAPLASVPVILLTAKADNDLESESVRSGVDMFMTKPFDAPLLKARVAQMLRARADVRDAARIEHMTAPRPIEAESDSERQLAAVTEAIESHISDTGLGVAMVCELTGMQSKQLYRLVKRYVGLSPVDYIRQTRLRKAAMLLRQDRFTVSEVMYMVGFSSPSYFSKCFAALYGCKPSQYHGE
ncbi:MAG: ATP-binding protein [Bacteroidales bacterium]|nr:ATP-binding protein [Bacteroidales bacterium]